MKKRRIRPIAICLFLHHGRLLVFEGFDSEKGSSFFRPLGGALEFGERSDQAVRREILEETGKEIRNVRLLGVMENIFTLEGVPGHEIVFVFDAEFVDRDMYARGQVTWRESDGPEASPAVWRSLDEFVDQQRRLVPEGLEAIARAALGT